MPINEQEVEDEIKKRNLTAPRITPDDIDNAIVDEQYYVFPGTTLTVCMLTLTNGFNVTGESASASPANYNKELGEKIARDNARNKIWALEGYRLKSELYEEIV